MEWFRYLVNWYVSHKNDIDFIKDIIFALGAIATFYGYFKFLRYLAQRKFLIKRSEMEYDSKLYNDVHHQLRDYVNEYEATKEQMRDIGIRLLYMKNYPYNFEDDGFRQELYYYFMSIHHKPSGYISGKGIYVMDHIWFFSESIYYNPINEKWFVDKKGKKFNRYHELKARQLVKRIPFSNILGYDFNSDWADKGEPVFYTKYKYYDWKLFADDLTAVNLNDEYPLANTIDLKKKKRAKRYRKILYWPRNKIMSYKYAIRRRKEEKMVKKNKSR